MFLMFLCGFQLENVPPLRLLVKSFKTNGTPREHTVHSIAQDICKVLFLLGSVEESICTFTF